MYGEKGGVGGVNIASGEQCSGPRIYQDLSNKQHRNSVYCKTAERR